MHSFKDSQGRTWEIAINVAAIKRVKGSPLKLDLLKLMDDGMKPLGEFLADAVLLVDTLYVLCQPQCEKAGVTDEQFGESMGGDVLFDATQAFVEELIGFFPEKRTRETLQKLMRKNREVVGLMLDRADRELETLDASQLVERLTASSGNGRASSASTLTPSPSANST